MLSQMHTHHDDSYFDFTMTRSLEYRQTLLDLPLSDLEAARNARMAADSLVRQGEIEASDAMSFEMFRRQYTSQEPTAAILARQQG
jgi:hypothetical protein